MNFLGIKAHVMAQTNNDLDDLEDALPHLMEYINEGYDLLLMAWEKRHVGSGEGEAPRLIYDDMEPLLPEWTHRAIGDWASWLMYRNGNPQKQQRGMQYKLAFLELLARIRNEGGKKGRTDNLRNVYAPIFYPTTGREAAADSPFEC